MTRVKIESPGISVEIDGEGTVHELCRQALKVFRKAGGWPQDGDGPAYGFSQERRGTPPSQPSAMRAAPGPYPHQVGFTPATEVPSGC